MTDSNQPTTKTDPTTTSAPFVTEPIPTTTPDAPPVMTNVPTATEPPPPVDTDNFTVTSTQPVPDKTSGGGSKKLLGLVIVLIILFAGLGAGLVAVRQSQDIRQRADTTFTCCASDPTGTCTAGTQFCDFPDGAPCACLTVQDCDGNSSDTTPTEDRWCSFTQPGPSSIGGAGDECYLNFDLNSCDPTGTGPCAWYATCNKCAPRGTDSQEACGTTVVTFRCDRCAADRRCQTPDIGTNPQFIQGYEPGSCAQVDICYPESNCRVNSLCDASCSGPLPSPSPVPFSCGLLQDQQAGFETGNSFATWTNGGSGAWTMNQAPLPQPLINGGQTSLKASYTGAADTAQATLFYPYTGAPGAGQQAILSGSIYIESSTFNGTLQACATHWRDWPSGAWLGIDCATIDLSKTGQWQSFSVNSPQKDPTENRILIEFIPTGASCTVTFYIDTLCMSFGPTPNPTPTPLPTPTPTSTP